MKENVAFWNNKYILKGDINLDTKKKIIKTYVWSVLNNGTETWMLNANIFRKLNAFEMWCCRRTLKISWTEKITNTEI